MNKTYLTIILILLGLILLGTGYYFLNRDEGEIVCTQEAKECPDGSFVGRKPLNVSLIYVQEKQKEFCFLEEKIQSIVL